MTQDDIIKMADASGLSYYGMGKDSDRFLHHVETFADLVAAAKAEECAKVAEQFEPDEKTSYVMYASKAIRARSQA
jgi:hypothetical protein